MEVQFAHVLVFFAAAVAFIAVVLLLSRLITPPKPDAEKDQVYECGERPIGTAWFNFNPRFYTVALVFVIFDVEVAFMYPVATVFKSLTERGLGVFAYVEIFVFVAILALGLAYAWMKGDLQWVKDVRSARHQPSKV